MTNIGSHFLQVHPLVDEISDFAVPEVMRCMITFQCYLQVSIDFLSQCIRIACVDVVVILFGVLLLQLLHQLLGFLSDNTLPDSFDLLHLPLCLVILELTILHL